MPLPFPIVGRFRICEDDAISIVDIDGFTPNVPLTLVLSHADGSTESIVVNHSYNSQQIEWFRMGSALNLIKEENKA